MGVHWTTEPQRAHLSLYKLQFSEVQSSTSARTALIDKVLKEFEGKWGPDTWNLNGLQFEGTEEKILASKRIAMFARIEKWFRNNQRPDNNSKSKPTPSLLPLSANVKGIREADGKPRHRMAKSTDKYYEMFIKPNNARRNLLSSMFEAYKSACEAKLEKPSKNFIWRVGILADWLAEESEDVRQEVERARRKEMGIDVEAGADITMESGSTSATVASAQEMAKDAAEKKRLERAQKQEEAVSRLPASLYSVARDLEGLAMAKGVILLGVPVPSRNGKITIFKRNIGTTLDTKDTFESFVGEEFDAQVMAPLAEFLKKAFPQDIAEQMSLKSALDDAPLFNSQVVDAGSSEQSETPTAMEVVNCTESGMILGRNSSSAAAAYPSGAANPKGPRQKAQKSRVDAEDDISSDESDGSLNLPSSDGPTVEEDSIGNKPARSTRKTPYELEREKNLRRNALLLKDLRLDSIDSFFPSKKKKPEQPRRLQLKGPVVPIRRSARISSSGEDSTSTAVNLTDHHMSDSLSVPPVESQADLQSVDPQTELPPQDDSLRASNPSSTLSNKDSSLAKTQGLPNADAALDETPACQSQPPSQYKEQSKEFTDSIRQPGVEIMVPLGVQSTAFEAYLEGRQRLLHDPDTSISAPVELLPPGALDDTLFQVFHLGDVKPPELRPKAEWILEAERLLCQTFSGKFAKLAVRYWIEIEEILEYPGSKEGFSTKGRPAVLAQWFKYGRDYKQTPKSITDLALHGKEFIKWWVSLQPLARRVQGVNPTNCETLGSLLIRPANVEADGWQQLSIGGKNGIFLVFLMLVWHKRLAKTDQDLAFVELALYDVCWALDKVLEDLKARGRAEKELENSGTRKRSAEELEDANESPKEQVSRARKKQRPSAPVGTDYSPNSCSCMIFQLLTF